jgi:hypothetical protein
MYLAPKAQPQPKPGAGPRIDETDLPKALKARFTSAAGSIIIGANAPVTQ